MVFRINNQFQLMNLDSYYQSEIVWGKIFAACFEWLEYLQSYFLRYTLPKTSRKIVKATDNWSD